MSYSGIATLAKDPDFQSRVEACVLIECQDHLDSEQPDQANTAYDALRGTSHVVDGFVRMVAQDPAIIKKAEPGDNPPDQSLLTDPDIQRRWLPPFQSSPACGTTRTARPGVGL